MVYFVRPDATRSKPPALRRDDPDYIASIVAAHVLGGSGNMTSRLFREVRENSVKDALTGCFTRGHALDVGKLAAEIGRAHV